MIILSGNQPLQTPKMMAKIRRKKKEKKKTLNTQKLFSLLRIFFFLPFWFNWMSLRESERAAHLSGKMRQSVERVSGVATCTCRRIESVGLKRRPWIFPMRTMKNSEKKTRSARTRLFMSEKPSWWGPWTQKKKVKEDFQIEKKKVPSHQKGVDQQKDEEERRRARRCIPPVLSLEHQFIHPPLALISTLSWSTTRQL